MTHWAHIVLVPRGESEWNEWYHRRSSVRVGCTDIVPSCPYLEGGGERGTDAHHVGPIGSKVAYEYVSRDDPKQTIDSHRSISISLR